MPPLLHLGRARDIAESLAARLAAGRGPDPLAPWSEEVVIASGGVAAAIGQALLQKIPSGYAALQLRTVDGLARSIVNEAGEYPHVADDAERRLAMRSAVRVIDDPMMESRGIASMLERSYRDVRDSGVTLTVFRARIERGRGLRNRDRSRLLLRVWGEYERFIQALGAIDPSDLFSRAIELLANGAKTAPQLVAGFYDMTGVQLQLVDALRGAGLLAGVYAPVPNGDDPAPYSFADPFLERWGDPLPQSGNPAVAPPWEVVPHETRLDEIRAACGHVAALLGAGTPPSDIGIVARSLDAHDVRLFGRFANEHGFAVSANGEVKLTAQRIGRSLASLLRLRERGFLRGDVLELLRDGLQTATRIDVDRADRHTRERRIAGGSSEELLRLHRRSPLLESYIAIVAELEELTARVRQPLRGADWAEWLDEATSRFRAESERDLQALAAIDGITALFRRADRTGARFDTATLLDALEHASMDDAIPADGRPLIWLSDVMKLRGRSFQHLLAVRMQDELFPQRRVEDPLIPDSDRRQLEMREIGDGRTEEQFLFQLLLDGAVSRIRFTFAATDGFGKSLRPSPLLKNLAIAADPAARQEVLRDFLSWCQRRFSGLGTDVPQPASRPAPTLRQLQLVAKSGTRSPFDGFISDPRLLQRFAVSMRAVTPTQLEDFGECPQKFFFKHLLGVVDIDDPERELQINHRQKGSVDHRILENFYRSLGPDELLAAEETLPRLPDELRERLEAAIDAEFRRIGEEAPPFNPNIRAIETRATKRILRDFVAADLADLASLKMAPRWFEYRFGAKYIERGNADHPEPFTISAAGVPINVDGVIDRIDAGGGHYRIVDYKSGKALRHQDLEKKIDRGVRLQLALYAMAVSRFFGVDPASVSGTIKPLVLGEIKPSKFAFELAAKSDGLRDTLDIFAGAVLHGLFPAFPNDDDKDFNSCKYCPVNQACRTKHDPEEAHALWQWKEPRGMLEEVLAALYETDEGSTPPGRAATAESER
jgi:hypothetical protein